MKLAVVLACVAVVLTSVACYPINVDSSCRDRVNECLKGCPTSSLEQMNDRYGPNVIDARSGCERACHDLCPQQWL